MQNTTPLDTSEISILIEKYKPFLAEARRRILITFVFFLAATFAGFLFYENILRLLINLLGLTSVNLVFTSPFQFINLAITCGVACGLVLTFPLILIQLLSFLRPALQKKEFRTIIWFLPFSLILFVIGFMFGALVMRWQIQIFLESSISIGVGNMLDISRILTTIITTASIMGVSFQFPIIILVLNRVGLINTKSLRKARKWVYIAAVIFAILLPLDSIIADVLLSLPLIILFELTLFLTRFT